MAERKAKKSADELAKLVIDEVSLRPECRGLSSVSVIGVDTADGAPTTWYVNLRSGEPDKPKECEKAIRAAVKRLSAKFDLAT